MEVRNKQGEVQLPVLKWSFASLPEGLVESSREVWWISGFPCVRASTGALAVDYRLCERPQPPVKG